MNNLEIQEINETIAKAIGWTDFTKKRTEHDVILAHPPGEKTAWSSNWPNPYTSIDDAFEATKFIIKKYNLIFKFEMDTTETGMLSTAWLLDERGIAVAKQSNIETPEVAICLTLIEFIKEDK